MKKLSAYIPSLLISILLVILMICNVGIIIADINFNAGRTITLSEKKISQTRQLLILTVNSKRVRELREFHQIFI